MAEALAMEGYRVVEATNGAEALEAVAAHRPAVILLDMNMPVLDGSGFMRAYRALPGVPGAGAPVVVMTAAANARKWCEEVGGDAFLSKPFQLKSLFDVVARHARPGFEPGMRAPSASGGGTERSVLLVEDDRDLARIIA
jgi:two-component system, chemotaxis family, chemotaxis protein CheY